MNNPENEIQILKSRKILGHVVDSLGLSIAYFQEGRIKASEIYENPPVLFNYVQKNILNVPKDTTIIVKVLNEKEIALKNQEGEFVGASNFNTIVQASIGTYEIHKNWEFYRLRDPHPELLKGLKVEVCFKLSPFRVRVGVS